MHLKDYLRRLTCLLVLGFSASLWAQPANVPWEKLEQLPAQRAIGQGRRLPEKFQATRLDRGALQQLLSRAPFERPEHQFEDGAEISFPMPDGSFQRFRFVESPIMEPELAAKFPEIKTYLGQGIDDPAANIRFDITPSGFHAQIFSPDGAVYIDPTDANEPDFYVSYFKRDYPRAEDGFVCLTETDGAEPQLRDAGVAQRSGTVLRTYRLACAATAEYTAFHGGTVSSGMAAIVTAINRVNQVYESELSVRLVLVANNDLLVFTNSATDGYSNENGSNMLSQNQSKIDSVIGSANYDIGHVFSTGGGGVAYLRSVCNNSLKAGGVTGLPSPIGDPFYIDYVAHEMGHQFGGNHTFNSATGACAGGNRNASTAYEPGSGSTIQAYAGICGADNLQANSDPYFHSISFDEMESFVSGLGAACAVPTSTGNSVPTVSAGANFTIPANTPFTLTATGSDPDGDVLTYCWEQRDLGPAQALTAPDNGSSPLFRSFNPTTSPSRTFPKLSSILANTSSLGEKLPTTSRTMNFRVTARDNKAGGGGVNTSDMQVTVVSGAGPFVVTAPNSNVTWSNAQTVTWNVAGTAAAPINAANVNILLSTNGGLTFPIVLKSNTPNDGSERVQLPNVASSAARIKVEAAGNIFFDVSNTDFTIITFPPAPAIEIHSTAITAENCTPNNAIDPGETVTVDVVLHNIGSQDGSDISATLLSGSGVTPLSSSQNYGLLAVGGAGVSRPFTFQASGACGGQISTVFEIREGAVLLDTVTNTFVLGTLELQTVVSSNLTRINLPASGNSGIGSPYPSVISLSGLNGTIANVSVTLSNVTHTWPDDIDILLVGPNGQKVMLMSDAGGGGDLNGVTLTFDDNAEASLPDATLISSGIFKPTNHGAGDSFPSPAPAGPFGSSLALFNGSDPNGAWSLYTFDDQNPDKGAINNGWSIAITLNVPSCCSGNTAPFVSSIDDQFTDEDVPVLVPFSVGDAETPAGSLLVTASSSNTVLVPNGNINISGTGTNRTMTLTPAQDQFGSTLISVEVSDGAASVTNSFLLTVNSVNDAPVLATIANRTINEHSLLLITNSASDIDTPLHQLTFSLGANAPVGAAIDSGSGVFSWTPSEAQGPGTYTIRVVVSDNESPSLSDTKQFDVVVNEVNEAPVLAAIANRTIHAGTTLVITNSATDADLPVNNLTFSLLTALPGASVDGNSGIFSWTPADTDAGSTNMILLQVADDGVPALTDSKEFSVAVVARPFTSIELQGTNVLISWNAVAGQTYHLQVTTNLNNIEWFDLSVVTAAGSSASAEDAAGDQERYYRVTLP